MVNYNFSRIKNEKKMMNKNLEILVTTIKDCFLFSIRQKLKSYHFYQKNGNVQFLSY